MFSNGNNGQPNPPLIFSHRAMFTPSPMNGFFDVIDNNVTTHLPNGTSVVVQGAPSPIAGVVSTGITLTVNPPNPNPPAPILLSGINLGGGGNNNVNSINRVLYLTPFGEDFGFSFGIAPPPLGNVAGGGGGPTFGYGGGGPALGAGGGGSRIGNVVNNNSTGTGAEPCSRPLRR